MICVAVLTTEARADAQTREVQQTLKDAGFYYGTVDGQSGAETKAALRRFQIRNGLQVTGAVSPETLSALKIDPGSAPKAPGATDNGPDHRLQSGASAPGDGAFLGPGSRPRATPAPSPERGSRAEPQTPPDRSASPDQRNPDAGSRGPGGVPLLPFRNDNGEPVYRPGTSPAGRIGERGASALQEFFAGTEFADADYREQSTRLASAQLRLRRLGYYKGVPDGLPGPATEEALLNFQYANRLRSTGHLDDDTMEALDSAQVAIPGKKYRDQRPGDGRVYRGIWVQ